MTLIGPILDDRSYEDLRRELVNRIAVYTPEWTDHNESDPGIVLLELFAHLGESLLFRFNQIPDATRVAFLRLLGVQPRPAQLARTLLTLETERPDGVHVLREAQARAGAVPFQTEDEVHAWPLEVYAVGKIETGDVAAEPSDPAEQRRVREELRRRRDAEQRLVQAAGSDTARQQLRDAPKIHYQVVTVPGDPTDPEAQPLDVSTTVDQTLWVALLARSPALVVRTSPDQPPPPLPGTLQNGIVYLGIALDEQVRPIPFDLAATDPTASTALPASTLTADPPAVLWELWTGPPATPGGRAFVRLDVVGDTTRGLTTTGVTKLELPDRLVTPDPAGATSGDWDSPPPLDDPQIAQRVVGWLRVRRPPGENDAIHGIRWVGVNAVGAVQARTASTELLGTGNGDADQTYRLTQRPVVPGTVVLEVEEVDGWHRWTEVETFAASRAEDEHYVVDLAGGLVRFGTRSRIPQIGQRIRVVSYRYGGGIAGNVPAGAINALSGVGGVTVTNVLPALGGADPASLAEALEQIPGEVHRRDRAVTVDDFRTLALAVPGVRRAEVLPLFHPDVRTGSTAGVVSVVVFPNEDLRNPAAPTPDVALLRRVAAYLDPRRLVTCELYVIPPTYRQIAVSVGVRVRNGYQVDAVRRWVELILRQYLAPVPPFGPNGEGWPLGRAVRRAELEAVAVQVDGVEYLEGELRLRLIGAGQSDQPLIRLQPWEVPELASITVVRGTPLEPGAGYPSPGVVSPGNGDGGGQTPPPQPVLVPLPPDVC